MRRIFLAVFIVVFVFFAPSRASAQGTEESDSSRKVFHSLAYQNSFGGRFQGIGWIFEIEKKKRGKVFGFSVVELATPRKDRILGTTIEGGFYTKAVYQNTTSLVIGFNVGLLMGHNKPERIIHMDETE